MTLLDGKRGKTYIATGINLANETERRLEVLGLTKNTSVQVVNSKRSGAMIIKVRGTRFAIGRKIAEGIQVNEC